ncbi:MAG: AbrB/MazE/SpoVT family DNA-binding domain-containing protein [Vulcanimicrobiaceae bacterium]
MRKFVAKLTSKNQLTLPKGVSAFIHARPGDSVSFCVDEEAGRVEVRGPSFEERLEPWVGRWATGGQAMTTGQVDNWVRDLRGERE